MRQLYGDWHDAGDLSIRRFTCGFCGHETGTKLGYRTSINPVAHIYICGSCNRPTFVEKEVQSPAPKRGKPVVHLPTGCVAELYDELRAATSVGAYTAAVIVARTLLAAVAVDKGAKLRESFLFYVEWLESQGYTTAPMKGWVDHIRDQANVSAHELKVMDQQEATRSLAFAEMLLRIVYEFPGNVPPP